MRKKILVGGLLVVSLIVSCAKDETVIPTVILSRLTNDTTYALNAIFFTAAGKGFTAGNHGMLLKSDGGDTWQKVNLGTVSDLNTIAFPSPQVGYIAGGGALFKTTDGGNTWTLRSTAGEFKDAAFPTDNKGYMISGEDVLKTTDGGQTWNSTGFPFTAFQPFVISASGGDTVFVADTDGDMYVTVNGGGSWQTGARPGDPQEIYFRDKATGIAASDALYKTSDGGQSWRPTGTLDEFLIRGIHMTSGKVACAVGDQCIFVSKDSGESFVSTFTQDGTSIQATLRAVFFVDDIKGFAVSEEGNIYKIMLQ